jgi:hypothetical protein
VGSATSGRNDCHERGPANQQRAQRPSRDREQMIGIRTYPGYPEGRN